MSPGHGRQALIILLGVGWLSKIQKRHPRRALIARFVPRHHDRVQLSKGPRVMRVLHCSSFVLGGSLNRPADNTADCTNDRASRRHRHKRFMRVVSVLTLSALIASGAAYAQAPAAPAAPKPTPAPAPVK